MALIGLQNVSLGFGGPLLLDDISLQIESGEWIGLLGRNGAGKSTLLKLVNGDLLPQSGLVARQQNIKTAYLPQEVPLEISGVVRDIVSAAFIDSDNHVDEHWQRQLQVDQVISRMELDGSARFETLSAGMKRRVLLARGLVNNPDLLLLDEPTNHLDIDSIAWLEDFLTRWGGTLFFVTHDRQFLQRVAHRIVELDRGRLFDWNCDYNTFLSRKEAMLKNEQEHNLQFDKKLAQEEAWIRRGIEARRTRNEGRVRSLIRLREQRSQRREALGKVKLQMQEVRRSGRLVIVAENLTCSYGEKTVLKDFSTVVQRGDKVGIIGPNGSGKTTLIRLLIGELTPRSGSVELGTNLQVTYFDQLRAQLDENKTVMDNVGEGRDTITINGRNRNLVGYLEDFLFTHERVQAPISALSGGERNRLLLARLFAKPSNLLVMDEPTNDLDLDTLELLEDLLLDYEGTLLLVSHDRQFLNNLVTSTIALDGSGKIEEFAGGYDDWRRQSRAAERSSDEAKNAKAGVKTEKPPTDEAKRKPTYKELKALEARQQELAELPARIEALEAEQAGIARKMADAEFYQGDEDDITRTAARLKELEEELAAAYARWEELDQA